MGNPKFSIIIPHYDKVVSDERLLECLDSVKSQTYVDYEVLLYHDGPLNRPLPNRGNLHWHCNITKERVGDWGHSLRSLGIQEAKGEYIVHLNADNLLYSNALEEIDNTIDKTSIFYSLTNPDLIVFSILLKGQGSNGEGVWRDKNFEDEYMILTGYPPLFSTIDCMQLVMKRSIWIDEGSWDLKCENADGYMYPVFIKKYKARYCSKILGEHR